MMPQGRRFNQFQLIVFLKKMNQQNQHGNNDAKRRSQPGSENSQIQRKRKKDIPENIENTTCQNSGRGQYGIIIRPQISSQKLRERIKRNDKFNRQQISFGQR